MRDTRKTKMIRTPDEVLHCLRTLDQFEGVESDFTLVSNPDPDLMYAAIRVKYECLGARKGGDLACPGGVHLRPKTHQRLIITMASFDELVQRLTTQGELT